MKRLIIHHNDADGQCAAAIVHYKFCHRSSRGDLSAQEYLSMDYPARIDRERIEAFFEREPWCEVWILDFSLPEEDMLFLLDLVDGCGVVYWFDHHKTAIEGMPESITDRLAGVRRDGTAACMLVWEYLFPGRPAPPAVRFIADRDVWAFEFGDFTRGFYEVFMLEPDTGPESAYWVKAFDPKLDSDEVMGEVRFGVRVWRGRMEQLKRLALEFGYEMVFRYEGREYRAFRLNAAPSGDLGQVIKDMGYDIAWTSIDKINAEGVIVIRNSLYSDVVDVGALCRRMGGGGHKGAAGYVVDTGVSVRDLAAAMFEAGEAEEEEVPHAATSV